MNSHVIKKLIKKKKYLSTNIIENKYNVTRHSTNTRENLDNNKEEKIKNIIRNRKKNFLIRITWIN